MARAEIPLVIFSPTDGQVAANASVNMTKRSDGTAAAVYSAEVGGSTLTQPLTTDDRGRVTGWMERGAYNAAVTIPGVPTYTEPFDIVPGGDATVDSSWLGNSQVTTGKIAQGAATGDRISIVGDTFFPGTPVEGQLFSYLASDTNGVEWLLRVQLGGLPYRWRFVGGSPLVAEVATDQSVTADSTWRDPTTVGPQITIPISGEYSIAWSANVYSSAVATNQVGISRNDATPVAGEYTTIYNSSAGVSAQHTMFVTKKTLTMNDVIKLKYFGNGGGTLGVRWRKLSVTPIRLSG